MVIVQFFDLLFFSSSPQWCGCIWQKKKNCNCLGHFLGIHGDCSTSVREEFHPNPLQIQIQIYNTAIFNHRSLFRYANSSTLHSYGCLWVSEWAEFHTSVAWSLFLYWKCVFPFEQIRAVMAALISNDQSCFTVSPTINPLKFSFFHQTNQNYYPGLL